MQKGVQGFGGAHRHYHYAVDGAMHLCLAVYGRVVSGPRLLADLAEK